MFLIKTKMKCLALACSPRRGGNTALLVGRALEACREAGRYFFKMLGIVPDAVLCYDGVDKKGEILKHQRAMDEVYRQAQAMAQL